MVKSINVRAFVAALALSTVLGASAVFAQAYTDPAARSPAVQPLTGGTTCPAGYTLATYQGQRLCVNCGAGYAYTRYKGQDLCVSCPPGYAFGTFQGQQLCRKP